MNGGSKRGQADGFNIDMINKLSATKSSTAPMSLQDYVISQAKDVFPEVKTLKVKLEKVYEAAKGMTLNETKIKVTFVQNKYNSTNRLFQKRLKEIEKDKTDALATAMPEFFEEAKVKVEKLEKLAEDAETELLSITNYFLCADDFDDKTSTDFFKLWTSFTDNFLDALEKKEKAEEKALKDAEKAAKKSSRASSKSGSKSPVGKKKSAPKGIVPSLGDIQKFKVKGKKKKASKEKAAKEESAAEESEKEEKKEEKEEKPKGRFGKTFGKKSKEKESKKSVEKKPAKSSAEKSSAKKSGKKSAEKEPAAEKAAAKKSGKKSAEKGPAPVKKFGKSSLKSKSRPGDTPEIPKKPSLSKKVPKPEAPPPAAAAIVSESKPEVPPAAEAPKKLKKTPSKLSDRMAMFQNAGDAPEPAWKKKLKK